MVLQKVVSRNLVQSLKFCRTARSGAAALHFRTPMTIVHLQPSVSPSVLLKSRSFSLVAKLQAQESTESTDTTSEKQICVNVENLPFSISVNDIQQLFHDINLPADDIFIVCKGGRRTGQCFVYVKSEADLAKCIEKSEQLMGQRELQVRVSAGPEASPTELFGNRHAVRLMGVPFNVMNEDIVEFFSGINIVPNGIHIQGELGNRTGLCLIEVESNSDVEEALKRDKLFIGPRYVEVSRYCELMPTYERQLTRNRFPTNELDGEKTRFCVSLRGFPFETTKDEIVQFLDGVEIAGISMQRGQCTVYLTNEDDVTSALQKDKQYIGPRYVDVLPHDLTRPAARHTRTGMIGSETDFRIMLRGYPFETTENDIRQFLEGVEVAGIKMMKGECTVYLTREEDLLLASRKDKQYIGSRYVDVFVPAKPNRDMDAYF